MSVCLLIPALKIKKMNFEFRYSDYEMGLISVYKNENCSSLSSLLDLKITAEKFSISINVVSGTMSNIFGNIYNDPASENEFIETLFNFLEAKKIGIPFMLPENQLIEAIAS